MAEEGTQTELVDDPHSSLVMHSEESEEEVDVLGRDEEDEEGNEAGSVHIPVVDDSEDDEDEEDDEDDEEHQHHHHHDHHHQTHEVHGHGHHHSPEHDLDNDVDRHGKRMDEEDVASMLQSGGVGDVFRAEDIYRSGGLSSKQASAIADERDERLLDIVDRNSLIGIPTTHPPEARGFQDEGLEEQERDERDEGRDDMLEADSDDENLDATPAILQKRGVKGKISSLTVRQRKQGLKGVAQFFKKQSQEDRRKQALYSFFTLINNEDYTQKKKASLDDIYRICSALTGFSVGHVRRLVLDYISNNFKYEDSKQGKFPKRSRVLQAHQREKLVDYVVEAHKRDEGRGITVSDVRKQIEVLTNKKVSQSTAWHYLQEILKEKDLQKPSIVSHNGSGNVSTIVGAHPNGNLHVVHSHAHLHSHQYQPGLSSMSHAIMSNMSHHHLHHSVVH